MIASYISDNFAIYIAPPYGYISRAELHEKGVRLFSLNYTIISEKFPLVKCHRGTFSEFFGKTPYLSGAILQISLA